MRTTMNARLRREARETHPPATAFTPEFAKLLDEFDALAGKHGTAQSERAAYARDRSALEPAAIQADARAAAASAREGNPSSGTPNMDALRADEGRLRAAEAGLAAALRLVTSDIQNDKEAELVRGKHEARAEAARAKLTKAADALSAALTEAINTAEVVAWLNGHGYDTTAHVDARALSPEVAAALYQPAPTPAHDVIRTLANITQEH